MNTTASYLNYKLIGLYLSDVGCKTVANMIKGKTPEEIRKLFNIVNDFIPAEEVLVTLDISHTPLLIHNLFKPISKW